VRGPAIRFALLLGVVPWLGACGREAAPLRTPEDLAAEAAREADEGRAFLAADLYGRAFALLDPVPGNAGQRASLALERARMLADAGRPLDARAWLRWAARLDPALRLVQYERGRLLDGVHPGAADLEAAAEAYRRYLQAFEAAGAPEEEAAFARAARVRLARLEAD
jgi:tetratricopeptide (TPR) repeat protein